MNPHAVAHGPCSATPVACPRARRCATGTSPRPPLRRPTSVDGPTVGRRAAAPMIRAGLARVRPLPFLLEGPPMACLCSLQLGSLLNDGVGDAVDAGARAGHAVGLAGRDDRGRGTRSHSAGVGLGCRDGCGLRAGQFDREIGRDGELCRSGEGVDGPQCNDGAFGVGASRAAGVADGERAVAECIGSDAPDRVARTRGSCSVRRPTW